MDKDSKLSATDWFNEGLKCFNKPDGIGCRSQKTDAGHSLVSMGVVNNVPF